VADAGHSLSDLVSDFVTLWAVRIGRLPPDEDHPYGHGKFEAVGSLSVSVLLFTAGVGIGAGSYSRLVKVLMGKVQETAIPTAPALAVAALSVVSKEWLYRITQRVGEQIRSPVVMANAWHHRSDAYSSILALGSIAVAMTVPGMLAVDSATGLLVAGMICMTGMEIFVDAMKQLTDTANGELVEKINKVLQGEIDQLEYVVGVGRVRARQVGSSSLVDVAVILADGLSATTTRTIEDRIRIKIMTENPGVLDADVLGRPKNYTPPTPPSQTTAATKTDTSYSPMESNTILEGSNESAKSSSPDSVMPETSPAAALQQSIKDHLLEHGKVSHVSNVAIERGLNGDVQASATVLMRADGDQNITTTLKEATEIVAELRQQLVDKEERVASAKIYLDLNDDTDLDASSREGDKSRLQEESVRM
jgi:cation diffusion facilitator family transporter